jgi:hypothetical protein
LRQPSPWSGTARGVSQQAWRQNGERAVTADRLRLLELKIPTRLARG